MMNPLVGTPPAQWTDEQLADAVRQLDLGWERWWRTDGRSTDWWNVLHQRDCKVGAIRRVHRERVQTRAAWSRAERFADILERRVRGQTLAEIGDGLGVSGEWIGHSLRGPADPLGYPLFVMRSISVSDTHPPVADSPRRGEGTPPASHDRDRAAFNPSS